MKKTWKKVVSLLMSVMVVFSMMGVPVMAEEAKAAPTEVASCTASGLWTTVLNFAFKDTAWMNAINSVTVNGTVYTNKTISSFGSDTNIWDIGSATGAYGSYTALRIVSPDTYPLTVDITAAGYQKLTMQVTKTTVSYQDVYTATIVPQQPVEKTYKATAAAATHGKVTLSKSEGIKERRDSNCNRNTGRGI